VRYRVELPRLLEALGLVGQIDRAVDIGAGGAYYTISAYRYFAKRGHSIEFDKRLCNLLRRELHRFPGRCTWQQGSILALLYEARIRLVLVMVPELLILANAQSSDAHQIDPPFGFYWGEEKKEMQGSIDRAGGRLVGKDSMQGREAWTIKA
jgi:predicted RNA methylase